MYKKYYSRFLQNLGDELHFIAHSHHFWPDVSRDAHLKYWDDSARLNDAKWSHILESAVPRMQQHIARMLSLKDAKQIVLAPNTHEFVIRILSTFDRARVLNVLTTDSEFRAFARPLQRLEEAGFAKVTRVHADALASNRGQFLDQLKFILRKGQTDLLFLSQVFFDSGLALTHSELREIISTTPKNTVICIDGYHAFAAIPTDLSEFEGRIFYMAGGYKYAQAGEGACFLVVPKSPRSAGANSDSWRPLATGWFAEMDLLHGGSGREKQVYYPDHAAAFAGSTFDHTGVYRFNAVWDQFTAENITVDKIHDHVTGLQARFLEKLHSSMLGSYTLVKSAQEKLHGHFLAFEMGSAEECEKISKQLASKKILTDYRGSRLRFGFGLYQDNADVDRLIKTLVP